MEGDQFHIKTINIFSINLVKPKLSLNLINCRNEIFTGWNEGLLYRSVSYAVM
jgi:hypothetical protein